MCVYVLSVLDVCVCVCIYALLLLIWLYFWGFFLSYFFRVCSSFPLINFYNKHLMILFICIVMIMFKDFFVFVLFRVYVLCLPLTNTTQQNVFIRNIFKNFLCSSVDFVICLIHSSGGICLCKKVRTGVSSSSSFFKGEINFVFLFCKICKFFLIKIFRMEMLIRIFRSYFCINVKC